MISTGDFRKGITIVVDGTLYQVVDYQHIKMGRGSAQVRMKLRDLKAGHILEKVVQAGTSFPRAILEHRPMQFLYSDGDLFYFMDTETFDQAPVARERLGDALSYIKEGLALELLSYRGETIGVELPIAVELKVADTPPSYRGDTAQGGGKRATLETGLVVQVPFHINVGDVVKVDTRTGAYLERAS